MTKAIRIENADNSYHKVIVQVWEKGKELTNGSIEPDSLVRELSLDLPTTMIQETIWDSRYLVIKEI